jgi:murein L,D-transpeptidase YcbB/YkuD
MCSVSEGFAQTQLQSRLGFGAGESHDERRKNNLQANLVTGIPVLIVYGTATANEEMQIRFFDDI